MGPGFLIGCQGSRTDPRQQGRTGPVAAYSTLGAGKNTDSQNPDKIQQIVRIFM